jgi:hypothetical protein
MKPFSVTDVPYEEGEYREAATKDSQFKLLLRLLKWESRQGARARCNSNENAVLTLFSLSFFCFVYRPQVSFVDLDCPA